MKRVLIFVALLITVSFGSGKNGAAFISIPNSWHIKGSGQTDFLSVGYGIPWLEISDSGFQPIFVLVGNDSLFIGGDHILTTEKVIRALRIVKASIQKSDSMRWADYDHLDSPCASIEGSQDTIVGQPECKYSVISRHGFNTKGCRNIPVAVGNRGWAEFSSGPSMCDSATPHYDTTITYGKCLEKAGK